MSNLKTHKTTPVSTTFPEWLAVSAAIGKVANTWADRHDIVAFAGPEAGSGSPATYSPYTGELELNAKVCFGGTIDPDTIDDLSTRSGQFEWPRATGAIFHEAMHARYSLWDIAGVQRRVSRDVFNAMILLEEGRIESQGLEIFPNMAGFLRTTAIDIVLADFTDLANDSDTKYAANVAALTLARVDAGSLNVVDVERIHELIEERLSKPALEKLRELWLQAQDYRFHSDESGLITIAEEWVKIVNEVAEENGESGDDEQGEEGAEGASGSGSGAGSGESEGSGESSSFAEAIAEALEEAAEDAKFGAYDDLIAAETQEEYEEIVNARSSAAKEAKAAKSTADTVFGAGTAEIHGTSSASMVIERRPATPAERSAAVRIGTMIDKAKYRERSETEINDVVPPGRLRSRAAVQAAAYRSRGVMSQVESWRRTVRRQTDDPTLSIGVMVDISGSMGDAMQPMASTAWIMSEAARRADARAAMVYYGNDVFSTLKPGQHLDQVRVWTAPDGTEKFDKAFKALDGGLGLLHGTGVRILVVVSDGVYTDREMHAAKNWIARCSESGVAVIWITNGGTYGSTWSGRICAGTKAEIVELSSDPTAASITIGTAAQRALAAVA